MNDKKIATLFWSKVEKTRRCWRWRGGQVKDGYGVFRFPGGKKAGAHRVAYELAHGPIPEGMLVLHRCDNPVCVRPDHLVLGTHQDNMRDRARKRRQARGEQHGRAKLSWRDVATIRRLHARRHSTVSELARKYGVSKSAIQKVVNRETWVRR